MQISARVLGKEYGLTAEEMNRVLAKLGFLNGTPGNYSIAPKALQYAVEKDFHRGTGGYAHYNRYWTTRTFDDSIKEVLNVSGDLVREVRNEMSLERAARYAAQAAARVKANEDFLAKQAAEKAAKEAAELAALEYEELVAKLKKSGKIGLIAGGVILAGYGIYSVAPKVKAWIKERKQGAEDENEEELNPDCHPL